MLETPSGPVEDTKGILQIAVDYYKKLFGYVPTIDIDLKDDFWNQDSMLSPEHFNLLESPFSEEEIKTDVFGSYVEGAPGPDGFPFLFYQKYWDLIKKDLIALVRDFEEGSLDIQRVNYAISKEPDAKDMKKFMPICLSNCSIKIFSKDVANRVSPVGQRLLSPCQSAFFRGRFILESVVTARGHP